MLASMNGWWRPGPISVGLTVAAFAAWVLWFRDRVLFGSLFLYADVVAIGIAGLLGGGIAYALEVGSRRARARTLARTASSEGVLEPRVWLSRAHETMDRLTSNASNEARLLRHNYVGSEHLLLGALGTDAGSTRAVERFGVTLDVARSAVGRLVPPGTGDVEILGVTPRVKDAFVAASRIRRELGHRTVRVPHVWLAMLDLDDDAMASRVLAELGVDRAALRASVRDEAARSSDEEGQWPRTDVIAGGSTAEDPPRAVRIGSSVLVPGTGPRGLSAAEATDPVRQAERCLELIEEILDAAGSRLGDLVRLRAYVRDAAMVDAVRDVCNVVLRGQMPAMSFVVAGLPDDAWVVMIEGEAIIGQYRAPVS